MMYRVELKTPIGSGYNTKNVEAYAVEQHGKFIFLLDNDKKTIMVVPQNMLICLQVAE